MRAGACAQPPPWGVAASEYREGRRIERTPLAGKTRPVGYASTQGKKPCIKNRYVIMRTAILKCMNRARKSISRCVCRERRVRGLYSSIEHACGEALAI